jgi:GGDEF domain-containing protein
MQEGPPRRRRARPVGDAPVDALLLRAENLTKGWLLALLEQAPLDQAPEILGAELARDGPRLTAAVVRALADDADLRRIEPGGALELLVSQSGDFAGARGVEATCRAVDTLGAVIWSALRSELRDPQADQVSELAERLTLVIELVRAAALRRYEGEVAGARSSPVAPEAVAGRPPVAGAPQPPAGEGPGGVPPEGPVAVPSSAPDPLWMSALEDEIHRSEQSGAPLSLLLVELEDADRVLAVDPPVEARATFGRFAQAVRSVVRQQDILASESDTRAWIIARHTGRLGAFALGSRTVSAVRAAEPWRGAPMTVSVGLAVFGEDGLDAASLIEAAERARFSASASGVGIVGDPAAEEGGEPQGSGPQLVG